MKQVSNKTEIDERWSALITNTSAVRAISSAIEGTIGPKGLDTLLVDKFGDIVVTNAGVTILEKMEVNHPAAKMLINLAQSQHKKIGDGTTTAVIMASAIIKEGVDKILKGVPPAKIITGIKLAGEKVIQLLDKYAQKLNSFNDPFFYKVAFIAGREKEEIAKLIVKLAQLIGEERLFKEEFKLVDHIIAKPYVESQVFEGIIISRSKINEEMPQKIKDVVVLCIYDELAPQNLQPEILKTEEGIRKFMELQESFRSNLSKLSSLGVNFIATARSIDPIAEEFMVEKGIMGVKRVSRRELESLARFTGARIVRCTTILEKTVEELSGIIGFAEFIEEDKNLNFIKLKGGKGEKMATLIVGGATEEVIEEKERIAKDSASALQAAWQGGVVPGEGAVEFFIALKLEEFKRTLSDLSSAGVECVIEGLVSPIRQILNNAGFSPLEKSTLLARAQLESENPALGIDCDSGKIINLWEEGIVDPLPVKKCAFQTALEVACTILRINTIIKMQDKNKGEMGL